MSVQSVHLGNFERNDIKECSLSYKWKNWIAGNMLLLPDKLKFFLPLAGRVLTYKVLIIKPQSCLCLGNRCFCTAVQLMRFWVVTNKHLIMIILDFIFLWVLPGYVQ